MNTAREALKNFGPKGERWGKEFYNEDGLMCSIGSVLDVKGLLAVDAHRLYEDPEVQYLAEVIATEYPEYEVTLTGHGRDVMDTIYTFNDADTTKFRDIERVFEKTAVWIDEKV